MLLQQVIFRIDLLITNQRHTVKKLQSFLVALTLASLFMVVSCQKSSQQEGETDSEETAAGPNALSEAEAAAGWELLFDGSTLDGWKRYNHNSIGPLWSVKDGVIVCDGEGLTEGTADIGGSLITTSAYENFELSLEWRISPGGNSGILYHVVEGEEYPHAHDTGPEYQVMDDTGWKDSLRAAQKVGRNYDMYAAPESKKVMPVGEWNSARLIYNGGHVEHWLNGEKVVEFEEGSPDFEERYKNSKWVDYPGWNKYKSGAIGLQDHGAPVFYRSIKIRVL
jgi:hypothetical protein